MSGSREDEEGANLIYTVIRAMFSAFVCKGDLKIQRKDFASTLDLGPMDLLKP